MDKINNANIQNIISLGGKFFALFIGITYICGFLTLNAFFYQ